MFRNYQPTESEYCYKCDTFRVNYEERELVCPSCGECHPIFNFGYGALDTHSQNNENKISFGTQPRNFRIFDDFLLSIQGLKPYETSVLKLQEIVNFLDENKLSITKQNIKHYLHIKRKYGWYNRTNNIYFALTNNKPPQITGILSFELKMNYIQLTNQFMIKPRRRKIFLENGYVVYKLLQMKNEQELGQELIPYQKKFLTNDKLFKELCEELGWSFIPTEPY